MQNHRDTLLAQYANSPTITDLVDLFNDWIDPADDLDAFYRDIWDIRTANDGGLDIWGRIVGVGRYLEIQATPTYWGFSEAYTDATKYTGPQPFGASGSMWDGLPSTQNYRLGTEVYRKLILVKAMANISDATVNSINTLMNALFSERGRFYVHDGGDMTMRYVFDFTLAPVEVAILLRGDVVPKPAGVQLTLIQLDIATTFGFAEANMQPFDSGTFLNP